MDNQPLCFSPAWPAASSLESRGLAAFAIMDEITDHVSEQLETLEWRHEIIFIYCGDASDGRPLVAIQIASEDMEVCLIEDVNGRGWVVCGRPGSERQSIRRIAADDRSWQIASACVQAFVVRVTI